MTWLSDIGNIVNPGDAAAVGGAASGVSQMTTPGSSYFQSGNLGLSTPGTQGNALVNAAAGLGANNVTANYTPMDNDASGLLSLGSQYYNQFLNGGKAEAAAKGRATSSMADAGGGGIAGIDRLNTASQQLSKQAEQTALTERGNAAVQGNADNLAAGMLAVKKAAFQTAVTHANYQKNLASQQSLFNLQSDQTALNQQLASGALQANNQLAMGQISNTQSQSQLGLAVLNAGAQGAAQAGGTIADMSSGSSATDPSATVSESEINNAAANTYAQLGIAPPSTNLSTTPALQTGQEAAQITQDQLNGLLGQTSSKIVYPTLQSDASQYLTSSAYPANTSVV